MKLHMSTNILKLIEPGTYGTRLEWVLEELDEDYIDDFHKAICDYGKDKINEILAEDDIEAVVGNCCIDNVTFNSPRFYNYENDWLEFDLEIRDTLPKQIWQNVKQLHNDFFEWIYKNYGSYSGFISFMPYTEEKYEDAIKGSDLERAVAIYLMYLVEHSNVDLEEYQNDFEQEVEEQANYNGWCTYDDDE